jgi:hypothetical protein
MKAVALELAIRGRRVGYLPGAGDDVAGSLAQMGYAVTTLTGADLTPDTLYTLDAVVIGIRAFNTRKDLAGHLPALFAYVEGGVNLISQYNQSDGLDPNWLAPFRLRISRDRVTDEDAPVTVLAPDHPALTTPNRVTRSESQPTLDVPLSVTFRAMRDKEGPDALLEKLELFGCRFVGLDERRTRQQ